MTIAQPATLATIPPDCKPRSIATEDEARAWLVALDREGLAWHPEDSPWTVGNRPDGAWIPTFSPVAAVFMRHRMDEAYDTGIDPCGVLVDLHREEAS